MSTLSTIFAQKLWCRLLRQTRDRNVHNCGETDIVGYFHHRVSNFMSDVILQSSFKWCLMFLSFKQYVVHVFSNKQNWSANALKYLYRIAGCCTKATKLSITPVEPCAGYPDSFPRRQLPHQPRLESEPCAWRKQNLLRFGRVKDWRQEKIVCVWPSTFLISICLSQQKRTTLKSRFMSGSGLNNSASSMSFRAEKASGRDGLIFLRTLLIPLIIPQKSFFNGDWWIVLKWLVRVSLVSENTQKQKSSGQFLAKRRISLLQNFVTLATSRNACSCQTFPNKSFSKWEHKINLSCMFSSTFGFFVVCQTTEHEKLKRRHLVQCLRCVSERMPQMSTKPGCVYRCYVVTVYQA